MAKNRSFSQVAEASNLPKRIKMDQLAVLGTVTWVSAAGDSARLPGTGEVTEGFTVTVDDKGQLYTAFVGAKVLVDTIARIPLDQWPFDARIVKDGQAWAFAD